LFKFSVFLALLGVTLLFGVYTGEQRHWFTSSPSYAVEMVAFLGVSMIIIFYFLHKRAKSPSFTQAYLLSIFLKMLTYGAFILWIVLKDPKGAVGNAVLFMISYMLFTAFEVGFLFKAINK
jgi:hypothetical protein